MRYGHAKLGKILTVCCLAFLLVNHHLYSHWPSKTLFHSLATIFDINHSCFEFKESFINHFINMQTPFRNSFCLKPIFEVFLSVLAIIFKMQHVLVQDLLMHVCLHVLLDVFEILFWNPQIISNGFQEKLIACM